MKFIYLIFLIATFLNANITISPDDNDEAIDILDTSYIYIDYKKNINIEDIKKNKIKFIKNNKKSLNFGYSPNFDVWIKLDISNNSDKKIKRVIEYANVLTTNISFYNLKENIFIEEGLLKTNKSRTSLTPIFKIKLDKFETKTYYFKVNSYVTSLIIELKLWKEKDYQASEIKKQLFYGLFFGAMIILILYNIFIYFFVKDISYLFYVFYLFGIVIHHLLYVGLVNLYLFNSEIMYLIVKNAAIFIAIPVIFLSFFTKSFLQTNQYKRLDKLLNILIIILLLSVVVFLVTDVFNKFRNLFAIVLMAYIFLITLYSAIKRNKQAYFILLGWFVIFIAGSIMYLRSTGMIDEHYLFAYIIEISFLSEALIFSIALAKKIDYLQKEKNQVKEELIYQKSTENKRLEKIG